MHKFLIIQAIIILVSVKLTSAQYYDHPFFSVPITTELYTSKIEIRNIHYLEYLHYVKRDSSFSYYQSQLPKFNPNDTLITEQNYFRYPKTRFHPVVYVSRQQANSYCKWLENFYKSMNEKSKMWIDTTQYEFTIRLPTVEEWTRMAIKYDYNLTATKEIEEIKKLYILKKKTFKKIAKENGITTNLNSRWKAFNEFILPHKIYAFENLRFHGTDKLYDKILSSNYPWPRKGFKDFMNVPFDLRGNVSELTQTEGVAKGGNWSSKAYEIGLYDYVKYSEPSNVIGFRCVCEIKER